MKNNTIEDIEEYAKNSQTIEKPTAQNYAEGTKVGWTLPAKWWNWLMNAFTKRFRQSKATVDSMYEELVNLMWPLVPGENETNDQCKQRIHGAIADNYKMIKTNESNISKNTTAINIEKQARISAIEQEQNSRTLEDNILDGKISSLSSDVDTNTSDIASLKSEVDTNTSDITNLNSKAGVLSGRLSSLASDVATNTENIKNNTEAIATNADSISTESRLRQNADISLGDRITDLKSEVDTNTSDITNLKSNADVLKSEVDTNTADIATNKTNITKNSNDITSTEAYLKRIKNSVDMHPFGVRGDTDTAVYTIDIPLDPSESTLGSEIRTPIHFIFNMNDNYRDIVVRLINNKDSWNSYDTVRLYISYEGSIRDDNLGKDVSVQKMSRYFVRLGDCERTTDGKFIISKLTFTKAVAVKLTINQYSYWKRNSD